MSSKIFRVSFTVENCPSKGITKCEICSVHFPKGEIRIVHRRKMVRNLHYHLNCYAPKVPQFIKESEINNCLNAASMPIFKEWLDNWNSKYFSLEDAPIISVIPEKSLQAIPLSRRRTLIEIFKFLPIKDIISGVLLASKEFYQICWDKELWQFFIYRDFQISELCPESKVKYIELYNSLCIGCKTVPSEKDFNRCPFIKKNICKVCLAGNRDFRLLNKSEILLFYGIDAKILDLQYGTSMKGIKVVYRFKVEQEICKFFEKQKEKILKMSQVLGDDSPFVNWVKRFDSKKLKIGENYEGMGDGSCVRKKFFDKVIKFLSTGKGKITESQILKEVNKKFADDIREKSNLIDLEKSKTEKE